MTHLSVSFIGSLFNTAFTAKSILWLWIGMHVFFYPHAKILSLGMNRQEKLSESLYWEHGIYN